MANKQKMSKKNRHRVKIVVFIIEVIVLLLVIGGLYVSLKMSKVDTGNELVEEKVEINELPKETQEVLEKYTTIAIFGLDNRSSGDFEWGNSDVIMLASISDKTKEIKLASVYRDTYLNLTNDDGYRKCNAAFAKGGVEQAVSMLNVNLDLDIQDYVIVDFNAVVKAIDLLGGIELEITDEEAYWMEMYIVEMNDVLDRNSSALPGAGVYNLDGVQATAYARVRYTAGDDFKRTERQRLVIEKMFEKAMSSDLATIDKLIDEVFGDVKTSFTSAELLLLAKDAFSYSMGENTGFPFDKVAADFDAAGDCVVPLDLATNVKKLHEFLYEAEEYEVSYSVQQISDEIVSRSGLSVDDIP